MINEPILALKNLSKAYNGVFAVDNLNLKVYPGEIYGFLGKNGAGKTTTIRMIMGLIRSTSGEIELYGKEAGEHRTNLFNRIGATIEYPGFYLNLTARENLLYYAKMRGIDEKKVDELLHFFGLSEASGKLTKNFSLGMKQRLGLARALLHNPDFLILDEPTNGLDPAGIHEIRETLKRLNRERGITILFSSHILSEVEQISKRLGIIDKGRLIDEFTLEEFKKSRNSLLELKVSDLEAAEKLLSAKFNLKELSTNERDTIYLPWDIDQPAAINRLLVQNNIDVNHLAVRGETLEDRFMRLTGGEE